MSDAEDFTGGESTEKDLVADFLMREQNQLAELQDNFDDFGSSDPAKSSNFFEENFNVPHDYGTVINSGTGDFDSFTGGADTAGGGEYGNTEESSTDTYSSIKQHDRLRIEPEKLRIWREEHTQMLLKKDAESEKKKAEWREIARRELDEWHKHREEQLEKSKKVNRESEDAFVRERDEKKPGGEWERVCRLCDFNPKGSRNTKDVSRMRSILLQLKQTPVERQ